MRIGVVGFGAATIGLLSRLENKDVQIDVYEKAKDIYSSSVSGIRADGKIFISSSMGGDIDITETLQREIVEYYLAQCNISRDMIEQGSSFRSREWYDKFYRHGFEPILSDYWHIGTDELKNVITNIYNNFQSAGNINFHFGNLITEVRIENDKIYLNQLPIAYDKIVVAVGRTGHGLVNHLIESYPHLILENTKVDLGIRYELPDHMVEAINKEMYEFKVKLRTGTGYTARTFCNNPSGYVVTEDYDDFVTVNGHAKLNQKSNNTNFAILVTHSFTEPFNEPVGYGTYIAKLSNILAGGRKVILQTYGDFKRTKRTKNLGRVVPTLNPDKYILGDLNLAIPGKTRNALIEFIDKLNDVIPGVGFGDNLMYGMEIKFYSNKLSNDHPQLKFIGDCSGWTRSITYATAQGILMAEEFIQDNEI
ncbi:MAG: hypothetical protein RAO94_07965 [Candidatus Stygibacter australis]|nr:hypothetical protein [Candidatus Stygibacter australis]MDP8322271.1 hypothetical protein [Candidatus Stygibacter australis]